MTNFRKILCSVLLFRLVFVTSQLLSSQEFIDKSVHESVDLGSCGEFGRCSQICVNSNDSSLVKCSCLPGFQLLSTDKSSCHLVDDNATLVFASKSGIRGLHLNNGVVPVSSYSSYSIMESFGTPTDVTYNSRGDYIYWTESHQEEAIWRSRVDGSEMEVAIDKGLYGIEGIAYDWIADNIYIAKSFSKILVCSGNFKSCSDLPPNEYLHSPRYLALFPNEGLIFWTSRGIWVVGIYRAGMDGSHPIPIIRGLKWPNGLTADQGSSRIYWADANSDRIECARLDGTDRRDVVSSGLQHPHGVGILGDWIYWTDKDLSNIQVGSKFNGSNRITLVEHSSPNPIKGLTIVHHANQPIIRQNDCKDAGCSHICVLGPKAAFRCLCPVGMNLDSDDNKTCLDSGAPKFLIGFNNTLKTMRFYSVGGDVFENYILEDVRKLGSMVYNPLNDSVILSDIGIGSKKIVEFDFKTKNLSILVGTDLETVNGMDIDIVGQNLYWVDSDKGTVEVMSLRTHARVVLYKQLDRPMDILIIPDKQVLVIAQWMGSGGGKIVKMSMDGLKREPFNIVQHSNDFLPNSINFHREAGRLYWADAASNMIGSTSLAGRISDFYVVQTHTSAHGIASYGKNIYWTDGRVQLLRSGTPLANRNGTMATDRHAQMYHKIRVGSGKDYQHRPIYYGNYCAYKMTKDSRALTQYYKRGEFFSKLAIMHKDLLGLDAIVNIMEQHQCSPRSDKQSCSHICLISEKELTGTCVCPEGLRLDIDDRTCVQVKTLKYSNVSISSSASSYDKESPILNITDDFHLDKVGELSKIFGDSVTETSVVVVRNDGHTSVFLVVVILITVILAGLGLMFGVKKYRERMNHMPLFFQNSISTQEFL